MSAMSLTVA